MDCQVVHICDCIPARLPQALAELPKTLDETYERTLRGINEANWEFAHRMFQFVSVASRPLHAKELADLLAFDFEAGSIPKFHEDWRLGDPANAVLSTCSTLLAIVDDEGSSVIQFSHFSVKEFLTSTRLAEAPGVTRRYHISMTRAHTLAAQACLGILLHLDKDVTRDSLEDFPLAEYAAEHWVDHALYEGVSRNVGDGMKQLFDPSKPHLAICVWIKDPEVWRRPRKGIPRIKTPRPLCHTSLYYAVSWGLHTVVEFLITEHSHDASSRDPTNNDTPLHQASYLGQVDVARVLIERGADLTARDCDGKTPLLLALNAGAEDVARLLTEHGADVTARCDGRWTPLHYASCGGHVDVARMLIERGADLTAETDFGETPLHLALQEGQVDIARMLIERGADVTDRTRDWRTPLHLVSHKGVDVACMLIERGADVSARTIAGGTPLHLVSYEGDVDVARMLIEHGADVSAQNGCGETPLHLASTPSFWARDTPQKHAELVHMLLEHGADINARNKNGLTPFVLAMQGGLAEIIDVLVEHGAAHDNPN